MVNELTPKRGIWFESTNMHFPLATFTTDRYLPQENKVERPAVP